MEQSAIIRVWRALPSYNPALGTLSTFVERVVRNESISFLRSQTNGRRGEALSLAAMPVDPTPPIELRIDIRVGLSLLPDQERAVAAGLMAHTPTEVARRLGVARSTVYQRMLAIRRLFESIGLRSFS
jgi:RNA polymerase sigma factor (sigma-70 family)